MEDEQKEIKPWDRQKNEPGAAYALFNEYLKIGPLGTVPKLSAKLQIDPAFKDPPTKVALEKKSTTWNWKGRRDAYYENRIAEERAKLEARANQRLMDRLDKSEKIEDQLNDEILKVLSLDTDDIKPSKKAYALKMLSDAKKNEVDSQRLDLGEPTIIQKTDMDANVKTNMNQEVKEVNDLFDEAEKGDKTYDD